MDAGNVVFKRATVKEEKMVGYLMGIIAFVIALFKPVTDVQFVALIFFASVCIYSGSRAWSMLFSSKSREPKDERMN